MAVHALQGLFDHALDRALVLLHLPAREIGAVVGQSQADVADRHPP
jgi:hypothetical protein